MGILHLGLAPCGVTHCLRKALDFGKAPRTLPRTWMHPQEKLEDQLREAKHCLLSIPWGGVLA